MIEAIIGASALIIVALIGVWQNDRTRKMNTEEHQRAAEERQGVQTVLLQAWADTHSEVLGIRQDLKDHIGDPNAHGPDDPPRLHVVG